MSNAQASSRPFLDEFQDYWGRVPEKVVFAVLLGCWVALFQFYGLSTHAWTGDRSLFERLWSIYSLPGSDSEFAKLVPIAILVVLWNKRERLDSIGEGPRWPALALLAIALALQLVGFIAQQESISAVALFLSLYSLVGLAWGWNVMKETFFPFFLLAFCLPLGSEMDTATFQLRLIATTLTEFISHTVLGVPLEQHGTTLVKPNGHAFEVVAACSGLRSFTALLVVTTIYVMLALRRFSKRALLIAVTVPLAIACNVLRLTAMVVADRAFGEKAGHFVHDSDWIFTYGIAIATIMVLGHWLREKTPLPAI